MTQIDHVFVFPRDIDGLRQRLEDAGLVPSFSRAHPGQGTANLCYCFENTYLELLWVEDPTAGQDPQVARTALMKRGSGDGSVCPVGVAWRDDGAGPLDIETWDYAPPFLPPGVSIPVATESDDPAAPFLFRSPGTHPPAEWTDGRAGALQRGAGLGAVACITLQYPPDYRPGLSITVLARHSMLCLERASRWCLSIAVSRHSGPEHLLLNDIA